MKELLLFLLLLLAGCEDWGTDVQQRLQGVFGSRPTWDAPELGMPRTIADDVLWYEVENITDAVDGRPAPERLWVAMPVDLNARGCVLFAPSAMSSGLGGQLSEVDQEQLIMFARFGYAAVGYDVPGVIEENATAEERQREIARFLTAEGGRVSARFALDFIAQRLPMVPERNIWAAGEGMAGSLALLLGERESRVSAVIAYDPVTDIDAYLERTMPSVRSSSALLSFYRGNAPLARVGAVNKPVFLYHDSLSWGEMYPDLERYFLRCLHLQKDVAMADSLDGDAEDNIIALRTARTVEWLKTQE